MINVIITMLDAGYLMLDKKIGICTQYLVSSAKYFVSQIVLDLLEFS